MNGRFNIEVRSFLGRKVAMTPPPHVSGMLVDVLDPCLHGIPTDLTPVRSWASLTNFGEYWIGRSARVLFWPPLFIARLGESGETLPRMRWPKLWIFWCVAQSE